MLRIIINDVSNVVNSHKETVVIAEVLVVIEALLQY